MNLGDLEIAVDNTDLFKAEFSKAIEKALETVGLTAEAYAKRNLTEGGHVDTGRLRNSITHRVDTDKKEVIIGTNVEYAPYVELGTGVHYPGGRKGGWVYTDDKGETHFTYGSRPYPYLKPAATDHKEEYSQLFKSAMNS